MRENSNGELLVELSAGQYVTCAAGGTQLCGASGLEGDVLTALVIIPGTTSPGHVQIEDGATTITVFAGGATSVADLKPFTVTLAARAKGAGWSVITGANVTAIAVGNFT